MPAKGPRTTWSASNRLHEQLYNRRIDQDYLSRLQEKNNLFPHLDYRLFTPQALTNKVAVALAGS